jgi:hypothetical protein
MFFQIRITLYNISFGEVGSCSTENDFHTGRPKCQYPEQFEMNSVSLKPNDDSNKIIRELKIFDMPYLNTRVMLGCICDNQSAIYNQPLVFQSNSPKLELSFVANKLNITEDFLDIYFYASYEVVKVPDCRQRPKLTVSGGEESAYFDIKRADKNCVGHPWLLETKRLDHSLFILSWGSFLPLNPSPDELIKCQTKNRLIVYSGHTNNIMKIICPSSKAESRLSDLRIFSEDWMHTQFTLPTK